MEVILRSCVLQMTLVKKWLNKMRPERVTEHQIHIDKQDVAKNISKHVA